MDAQTVLGIILGSVTLCGSIVGVALYAGKSRDVAEAALHKTRNLEQAQINYTTHADLVFARKDVIAVELANIREGQERIEHAIESLRTGGMPA